ncbi:MAG: T9SS type A sorting domain-containing protein [Bacteroidota bacterium]
MRRCLSLFIVLIFQCPHLSAQFINEQIFPQLPYKAVTSSIVTTTSEFYVAGSSSEEWFGSPPFDYWGSYSQPYFILSPHLFSRKPILLPELEQRISWGLGGHGNTISVSSALATNDTLFVAWSNIKEHYGDIMPIVVFESTYVRIAKNIHDSLTVLYSVASALRPALTADQNDDLHIVWEQVTPLDTQWASYFAKYTSTIMYQQRNSLGELSVPSKIGKGFFPSIKAKNSTAYVLYFGADSSNQNILYLQFIKKEGEVFTEPQTLYTIAFEHSPHWDISYFIRYANMLWDVDSSGAIHIVWCDSFGTKKTYVIHHRQEVGTQIDSLDDLNARIRFMNDGVVKILSAKRVEGTDSLRVLTLLSKQGGSLQTVHSATFHLQGSLKQILVDDNSNEHVLVTDGVRSSIIKYASTDSATPVLLSAGYTISPGSFIDSTNRVWLTGKRDSTTVLLNFSLDEIGAHQDFVFPLRIGNEWHYGVYGDPPPPWPEYYDVQKISLDTLMPNGIRYFTIISQMSPTRYLRKDGLKVFQYDPADSTEHLRYDFSRLEGDTISPKIVITKIETVNIFGLSRRSFMFDYSVVPNSHNWKVNIIDSIGVYCNEEIGSSRRLFGAKINGRIYGTLLSVDEDKEYLPESFSLSQNYPNPFNPSTTIEFQLPTRSLVTLKVYDLLGREVAKLVNEEMNAGVHKAIWNAAHVSSGLYFVRMTSGIFSLSKKMLLLK